VPSALQEKSAVPATSSSWTQTALYRFERPDNAVVLYDHDSQGATSKPWLDRNRGWKAFGPGPASYNFLHYFRAVRLSAPVKVARKWRTAAAAMKAVDAEFPPPAGDDRSALVHTAKAQMESRNAPLLLQQA
jgi:hypothetical protein